MSRTVSSVATTLLLVALIACIIWASMNGSVLVALKDMLATPWGATTLLDLYIGLGFVAVWIAFLERNWRRSLPWIVVLPLLGNVVTLIYLLVRLIKYRTVHEAILGHGARTDAPINNN